MKKDREQIRITPELKAKIGMEAIRRNLFEYQLIEEAWQSYEREKQTPISPIDFENNLSSNSPVSSQRKHLVRALQGVLNGLRNVEASVVAALSAVEGASEGEKEGGPGTTDIAHGGSDSSFSALLDTAREARFRAEKIIHDHAPPAAHDPRHGKSKESGAPLSQGSKKRLGA